MATTTSLERSVSSPESLAARIRGEYSEMPGLHLTFPQACRLWHLDPATCHSVLHTLIREHFLRQAADGAFVALPTPRAAGSIPLNAALRPRAVTTLVLRRPA
jgi:hypothetical protein